MSARSVTKALIRNTSSGPIPASARVAAQFAKQMSACSRAFNGTFSSKLLPNCREVSPKRRSGGASSPCDEATKCGRFAAGVMVRMGCLSDSARPCGRSTPPASWTPLLAASSLVLVHPGWNSGPPAILKGYCDRVFLAGIAFRLEDGKVKPAMTHIRKLGVVTTYGASWLRATLAAAPPRRLVTRAFRHAAQSDRLTCMALYGMNRAGQARCAGCLARVEHTMEQF